VKWFVENPETVFEGLTQALREGDKEAFQEILEGYVKAKNILNISKVTKLSRATIYEAIDKTKNPSLATICKIMAAFEKAS
jgi:probable addiction module antidote protein